MAQKQKTPKMARPEEYAKYLVPYDKHFEGIEEYGTPRQFAELLKHQAHPINY